ncbi:MAG: undecaprenyl-diphosphate phosphatase [Candidatus Micrarchaeota archaeon]
MDLFQAIILASIQGIAEWLPISSSAHLAAAQMLMNVQPPIIFDIMLHVGTLIAAIAYFRKDISNMLLALAKFDRKNGDFKLAILIIVASIPTAIIGFAFKDFFESQFSNLPAIGVAMLITGAFLYVCERKTGNKSVGNKNSLFMGIAQGIAVMPGISRSGATIGAGLLMGISRESATRFSFLLSIPAIFGAAFFEWVTAKGADVIELQLLVIPALVSMVVGYFSIAFMMKFVRERGLKPFAYYCFAFGLLAIIPSIF